MMDFRRLIGLASARRPGKAVSLDLSGPGRRDDLLGLHDQLDAPVTVAQADLLEWRGRFFVRVRSTDGVEGVALASERLAYLWPILTQRVLPLVRGCDARNIERLVDAIALHDANYKLVGLPFWSCVAVVEASLFDLLGKTAGKSVGELLGGVRRPTVPVYLSSLRRDKPPEEEVAWLAQRLAATGAGAVKLKIGGRMSSADAIAGRTERLVALARRELGDRVQIFVDANGSYDVEQAIAIGHMLEEHDVSLFEEPCPWEDFEATKLVADQLAVRVAAGEQESSFEKFRWMIANRAVHVLQPDVVHNGGFVRTLRVARLAAAHGVEVALHLSKSDLAACGALHLASVLDEEAPIHEFPADEPKGETWYEPKFRVTGGAVAAPTGPGLGITIDPAVLAQAKRL